MGRDSETVNQRTRDRLPTGAVTFLFSDIEGSTQRWEQRRAAMRTALARHDALLREAIERNQGYVFKTVGDEFCAAFTAPVDAVNAALEIQRILRTPQFEDVGGLAVRIGIHTGLADERAGDYFGPVVNRTARLMSIGCGGQILISGATQELVRDEITDDILLTDMGAHRLKDLSHPEHVWQISAADLPQSFPPLQSLDARPNNLPMQVTSFVGRERDLADLRKHVQEHRLVTIFGAGGVGKTRMAMQLGADLLEQFSDGVWIADFSRIRDPEIVRGVVAQALGLQRTDDPQTESVAQHLRSKNLLLILDDCEHLVESIALLADSIHRGCSRVHIIATSRQPLGISGEKVLRLASLAIPQQHAELAPDAAITFGAVALFVDRASLVDEAFQLTPDNASMVAAVCAHLDGIPLAIELAAARLKVMSIASLAQRLGERFKLLTGGSRTALPRQKTLMALIDWSYDLLSAREQLMFRRLAIFMGGFTLETSTAVCAFDGVETAEVFDLVTSLADKSLLVPDTRDMSERYRFLESTREYALEKLTAGSEHEALSARHAAYFESAALELEKALETVSLAEWLSRVDPLLDDFRAVLKWSLGSKHDPALGGAVAAALEAYWWHAGAEAEGRRWIELGLRLVPAEKSPEVTARLRKALMLLTSRMLFS